jgi:hypothetical protein
MIRPRRVCSGGGAPKCSRQSAQSAALFISGRELSCSETSISPVAILIYSDILRSVTFTLCLGRRQVRCAALLFIDLHGLG